MARKRPRGTLSGLGVLGFLAAGLGGWAAAPSAMAADHGPARRCSVSSCFYQRDIRSYDILDNHTLVVYTGREHCPFLVTFRGPHCGLGIGPGIAFLSPRRENLAATEVIPRILNGAEPIPPGQTAPGNPFSPGLSRYGLTPSVGRYFDKPSRVCSMAPNTIAYTGAMPVGEETPIEAVTGLSYACVLDQVHSMNDDQLIGLYVKRKLIAPPPPVGPGSLSVAKPVPRANGGAPASGENESSTAVPGGARGDAGASDSDAGRDGSGSAPPTRVR